MTNFSGDPPSPAFNESEPSITAGSDRSRRESAPEALSDPWNYESSVAHIEAIINQIEMGEMELAEVFQQFAIAVEHLHHCETFLTHQKKRMDLLIETLLDEPDAF
jgi:exodeoxyribonuclease VII small subunit